MKYTVLENFGKVCWFKYKTSILHREGNLPAIEWSDRDQWYYCDGKYHRTNGPAVEYRTFNEFLYFINGVQINVSSDEEFQRIVRLLSFQ